MAKELIALAGDLVTERKRISEGLRRLEGALLPGQAAKDLYEALGASVAESVVNEVDGLARSMDRLGALIKTLVQTANSERLETCEPLLADAALTIEAKAEGVERPVVIDCKTNDVTVDREVLHKFRPIFLEMLETLVEFCVEPPKERFARKKRPKTCFQIEARAIEGGCRILVVCDGNGILPPLASDHGQRLAEIGVRAAFEGKPGQWSTWRFYVPIGVGPFRGVPVRVGDRRLVIPAWSVVGMRRLENAASPASPSGAPSATTSFALGAGLVRLPVNTGEERAHGLWSIEIMAGTQAVNCIVDDVYEPQEGFIKQLSEAFDGQGRFAGVVVIETETQSDTSPREELCLVLSPAYLVYGGRAGEPAEFADGTESASRRATGVLAEVREKGAADAS